MDLIQKILKEQGQMFQHHYKTVTWKNSGYRLKPKIRKAYFPSGSHAEYNIYLSKSIQTVLQLITIIHNLPVLFEPWHDCYCTFMRHSGILCCCFNTRNIYWRTVVHFSMMHLKTGGSKVLHCQIIFTTNYCTNFLALNVSL